MLSSFKLSVYESSTNFNLSISELTEFKMKLTKSTVEMVQIPAQESGKYKYVLHYDEALKGFGIRVNSKGKKSFFVEKRVQGKLHRISIGSFNEITVEIARKKAQFLLGQLAIGATPQEQQRCNKAKTITLREVFNEYINVRSSLKEKTFKNYEIILNQVIPDWMDKPLTYINRDLVAKRHKEYGNKSKASANYAMRVLRAIFNFAINNYQDANGISLILDNPIKRLSATRAWYRIERKKTVIKPHQLEAWYKGIKDLEKNYTQYSLPETISLWQDYFLLILFTGLRQKEAASLTWENVDLLQKTFQLVDTKNRSTHILPMSNFVYSVFERRRISTKSNFVFPSESDQGYIMDHRKAMWKITKLSGVSFKLHDLRRTFITVAESLDIPAYALKRLLNHKMNNDVTAGYIISDAERLRKPMQQVADFLLQHTKAKINI